MAVLQRRLITVAALLLLAGVPRRSFADPVVLTGGFVDAAIFTGNALVRFEGDGFFLRVGVDDFVSALTLGCTPCAPGITLNLGGSFGFPRGQGEAVVDGVSYSTIFVDGIAGTFTTTDFKLMRSGDTTVMLPFSFTGVVNGYLLDPFVHGFTEPAFTKTLAGTGTAVARFLFTNEGGPLFTAVEHRYDFANTAAPVPEPGTLAVCALGTSALTIIRRRRARQMAGR